MPKKHIIVIDRTFIYLLRGVSMVSIAELRARNNKMSQNELATKLGVSQNTISKWEQAPENAKGKNLKKVAQFFNVSVDDLLDKPIMVPLEENSNQL